MNLKRELMKLKTASPFMARVSYILKQLKCNSEVYTELKLEDYMLETVNAELKNLVTTMFLVLYVNKLCKSEPGLPRPMGLNGKERKIYYEFTFNNASLGNRCPFNGCAKLKYYPLCINNGEQFIMNETHLMVECSELEDIRSENGISWLLLEVRDLPLREQYRHIWLNSGKHLKKVTKGAKEMTDEYRKRLGFNPSY